ncbi:MAG: hypothetical protein KAJ28_04680 [Flavobacteriaceae bacterium]|nr:hypothetical protein [Flavobacteriaceae bacterium]
MLYNLLPTTIHSFFLIEQINLVVMLSITIFIFLVLLLLGVRRFFTLKAENKRLSNISNLQSEEDNKVYKDFTEGHLYDHY